MYRLQNFDFLFMISYLMKIMSHSLVVQNDEKEVKVDTWRSCCIEADRQVIIYFGQLFLSVFVLVFCAVMLVRSNGDCDRSSPYIGLISFILGKALGSFIGQR